MKIKMSHISLHSGGATNESQDTFLVLFKVHGEAIHLWPKDRMQPIGKTHSFRISCHNVDHPSSDIQVFSLTDPVPEVDKCTFHNQHPLGRPINSSDLAIFLTGPVASSRKASSYAFDLSVGKHCESMEDLTNDENNCEKVGTAYLYIDPKFSSQGIQRTPITATRNHLPIGQIQVEYLIITSPIAYGQDAPKPDWLINISKLDAGHRGAGSGRRMDLPGELLENTIDSFNYAHRHGADMCELDVLVSADGVPIIYHDFDVDAVAAQQSSDELGKLRVQVNEFTVKQLRDFRLLALNDGKGSSYTLNVPNQAESNRPFPTLAEVLNQVDESCALNIELKWPQLLPNGKNEATQYREINDFVDRILNCIYDHSNGRAIMLSTLNANIAIMLRLKQTHYPVFFVTTGDSQRFNDPTTKTIKNAIHFAQAFDMAGINPNAAKLTEYLVRYAQDRGLLVYAWGKIDSAQAIKELKRIGLNGVIYDKIDLIKPQD